MTRIRRNRAAGVLAAGLLCLAGCARLDHDKDEEQEASATPAHVEHALSEGRLATVTLTPEAETRLGIETVAASVKQVRRVRTLGGDLIVPPGRSITASAPIAGTLWPPESGGIPRPGTRVSEGEVILRLSPVLATQRTVLPPAERLALVQAQADLGAARSEAEGQVAMAEVRVQAAQIRLRRAEKLRQDEVGSAQALDDARAELGVARAELQASQARLEVLRHTDLEPDPQNVPALALTAPVAGVLQGMAVSRGQTVAAGAVLFQVDGIDPLWVRVPVYVGDLDAFDLESEVTLTVPGAPRPSDDSPAPSTQNVQTARPVRAPPSGNAEAATVDVFFEVTNADGRLRPGQRVGVSMVLNGDQESLVVPHSAVWYDLQGGTWVYQQVEPHAFVRRRVSVRYVTKGEAVLARGPDAGTDVVTAGVAELFGVEFGAGH